MKAPSKSSKSKSKITSVYLWVDRIRGPYAPFCVFESILRFLNKFATDFVLNGMTMEV